MLQSQQFTRIQPISVNSERPCNFVQSLRLFRNFGQPPVSSTNHSSLQRKRDARTSRTSIHFLVYSLKMQTCDSNVSHLPTKITAKDRAKQFPDALHESGGKLFSIQNKEKSATF